MNDGEKAGESPPGGGSRKRNVSTGQEENHGLHLEEHRDWGSEGEKALEVSIRVGIVFSALFKIHLFYRRLFAGAKPWGEVGARAEVRMPRAGVRSREGSGEERASTRMPRLLAGGALGEVQPLTLPASQTGLRTFKESIGDFRGIRASNKKWVLKNRL